MDQICLIKKDGSFWGVKEAERTALCMFGYLEEAEVFVMSWGKDPEEYEFVRFRGLNDILNGLENVMKDFQHATIDPPRRGQIFKAFEIQGLVDTIKTQIYHPYS